MGVHKNTGVNRSIHGFIISLRQYARCDWSILRAVFYMGVHKNTGVNRSIHGYT